MLITSKANPKLKKIASLSEKKYRKLYGEFIVESVKAVDECVNAGMEISEIVCTQDLAEKYAGATVVSDGLFEKISTEKSPQGVLAVVKRPVRSIKPPENSCLLLDRIQDPGNLGTIIRTANASGYTEIYAFNCTDAYSPKAVRASMGGVFYVTLYEGGTEEILPALDGVPVICADMDGENVFDFSPPRKFCLCIGNEGQGVSDLLKEKSAYTVKIPMRTTCESLNAGVSAGIAMYVLKNKI